MTKAEIYLRAAERIDEGEVLLLGDVLPDYYRAKTLRWFMQYGKESELFTRETRVLALCLMAAMEEE